MSDSRSSPRRKHIRLPHDLYRGGQAFSVTIATHERYPWFARHGALAEQVQGIVADTARERSAELFAWCLMPDHVHILVQDEDVMTFVRAVKGRAVPRAREVEPGRVLWQRSFYDHALREGEAVEEVARYIFENPVRAELVASPEEYPLSGSLFWPDWREVLWQR